MNSETDLWDRVLLGLVVVVVAFGSALVVFGNFIGDELFGRLGYGPDDALVPEGEAQEYVQFTYGVMGALMVGWMVTLGAVVVGPLRHREAWAWWATAGGLVTWFVLDSAASIAFGAGANMILNGLFLVAFAIPLLAIRTDCITEPPSHERVRFEVHRHYLAAAGDPYWGHPRSGSGKPGADAIAFEAQR